MRDSKLLIRLTLALATALLFTAWAYKNAAYYTHRGKVLYNQNKLVEAIASYRQATQLGPNNPRADNNLGRSDRCLSSSFKFTRYARSTSCFGSQ